MLVEQDKEYENWVFKYKSAQMFTSSILNVEQVLSFKNIEKKKFHSILDRE